MWIPQGYNLPIKMNKILWKNYSKNFCCVFIFNGETKKKIELFILQIWWREGGLSGNANGNKEQPTLVFCENWKPTSWQTIRIEWKMFSFLVVLFFMIAACNQHTMSRRIFFYPLSEQHCKSLDDSGVVPPFQCNALKFIIQCVLCSERTVIAGKHYCN